VASDKQTPLVDTAARQDGTAPGGFVGLRNFDEGIVTTMGAEILRADESGHRNYFIRTGVIPDVVPAPGLPGIPITFSHPEDIWERYKQPVIVVRRDDISPAMGRWHPGMRVGRYPALGANPLSVTVLGQTRTGFDTYTEKQQAVPFDITYTLSILARYRGKGGEMRRDTPQGFDAALGSPRNQVNQILDHILRVYNPFSSVTVLDSLGDERTYEAFMEALSHLDEVPEVTERVLGFAVTVRVEAELDLHDPETRKAVGSLATIRSQIR
jgi:hypothetical protein